MNRTHRSASVGWALVMLTATTIALGGCGRKGGLDLPQAAAPVAEVEEERAASQGSVFAPQGVDAGPTAAKGTKRAFILDPLLN